MKQPTICATCGSTADPKTHTPGSFLLELVLWLCFLFPGLIYSLWRLSNRHKICATCGSRDLIPLNSPRGQQLSQDLAPKKQNP